jgi:hypothetical protein
MLYKSFISILELRTVTEEELMDSEGKYNLFQAFVDRFGIVKTDMASDPKAFWEYDDIRDLFRPFCYEHYIDTPSPEWLGFRLKQFGCDAKRVKIRREVRPVYYIKFLKDDYLKYFKIGYTPRRISRLTLA